MLKFSGPLQAEPPIPFDKLCEYMEQFDLLFTKFTDEGASRAVENLSQAIFADAESNFGLKAKEFLQTIDSFDNLPEEESRVKLFDLLEINYGSRNALKFVKEYKKDDQVKLDIGGLKVTLSGTCTPK